MHADLKMNVQQVAADTSQVTAAGAAPAAETQQTHENIGDLPEHPEQTDGSMSIMEINARHISATTQ